RLLTLSGPGGVGKTRLAIAAGELALNLFSDGVWFVELAAINDTALVPQTVASAIGLTEDAGRHPLDILEAVLAERSLLIILDNCEHMLDACAKIAFDLLSIGSGVKILATSRQPLSVTGERTYRVPALSIPEESGPDYYKDIVGMLEFASVRLFVD